MSEWVTFIGDNLFKSRCRAITINEKRAPINLRLLQIRLIQIRLIQIYHQEKSSVLKQSSGTMIYCHFIIESNKHTFKAPGCPWWRSPPTGWASFNKAEPAMHIALVYISTFHPKLEKSLWWALHIIQNSLRFQIVVTRVGPAKTWSGLNFEI